MVHITYRHGQDSNQEKRVILKKRHFYISDNQTHDIHYVQFTSLERELETHGHVQIGNQLGFHEHQFGCYH